MDENSPPGTRVGSAVTATDPGDMLTYTISGGTNDLQLQDRPGYGPDHGWCPGPRLIATPAVVPLPTWLMSQLPTRGVRQLCRVARQIKSVTITINDVNEVPVITVRGHEGVR